MTDDTWLGQLAEEFTRKIRQGKLPEIEEYAAKHPELADRIRENFPTLLLLEGMAATGGQVQGDQPDPTKPVPGKTFGHYRIRREIGRGGMGIVYEAVHILLEKRIALKVLPVGPAMDAGILERFFREARTAAGLHHTNIVPVIDVGQVDGVPYYAMEFIEGRSLNEILNLMQIQRTPVGSLLDSTLDLAEPQIPSVTGMQENGTSRFFTDPSVRTRAGLPQKLEDYFRWVAGIGRQVAEGLAHAHERKVIHRDIKPSNLLIDKKGVLWITDFGLARRMEDPSLTQSGMIIGTPRYMSPEQASAARRPVDQRTDIYSLGATLYELLTCRHVFEGRTPHDVISQIITLEPVPPRRLNAKIPKDLSTIVMKAMAKRAGDRYQSASQLAEDLNRWLKLEPIKARRIGPAGRTARWCRRNPRLAAVTSTAGVLILALSITFYAGLLNQNEKTQEALQRETETRKQADIAREEAEEARVTAESAQKAAESERNTARKQKNETEFQQRNALYQSYRSNILAADLSYKAGEISTARELLASCDPSFRGWEWHYLHRSIDMSLAAHSFNDSDSVNDLKYVTGNITATFWDSGEPIIIKANINKYEGTRFRTIQGSVFKYYQGSSGTFTPVNSDSNAITISPNGLYTLSSAWNLYNANIKCFAQGSGASSPVLCQPVTYRSTPGPGPNATTMVPEFRDRLTVTDTMSGREIAALHHPNTAVWTGEANAITFMEGAVSISQNGPIVPFKDAIYLNEGIGGWFTRQFFSFYRSFHPTGYYGHYPNVVGGTFSQDGSRLATWSWDNTIYVWDIKTQSLLASLRGHRDAIRSVSFSPDMMQLASISVDGSVRLWSIEKGNGVNEFQVDQATVLAYSPNGILLAVGTYPGSIVIFDVRDTNKLSKLPGHYGPISALMFSPDSIRLATASIDDRAIHLWDVTSGSQISTLIGHTGGVSSVAFSGDGRRIVSASEDKTIRIWNARSQLPVLRNSAGYTRSLGLQPNGMVWTSNGERIMAYDAGSISIWDPTEVNPIQRHEFNPQNSSEDAGISDVAVYQDKIRLAITKEKRRSDGAVTERSFHVIDMDSKDEIFAVNSHSDGTLNRGIDLTPDASRAAVLSYRPETKTEYVQLWDTKSNRVLESWNLGTRRIQETYGPNPSIMLSPDGKLIARSVDYVESNRDSPKESFYFIAADRNRILLSIPVMKDTAGPMALFPDGKRIAFGSGELVRVWDLYTGKEIGILSGHVKSMDTTSEISAICVTPDGSRIVTGGGLDKTVRIWDAKRYEFLLTLRLPPNEEGNITAVAVSSDSKSIAAMTTRGKIFLWCSALPGDK